MKSTGYNSDCSLILINTTLVLLICVLINHLHPKNMVKNAFNVLKVFNSYTHQTAALNQATSARCERPLLSVIYIEIQTPELSHSC